MYRTHVYEFVPKLIGGRKRYLLELPENQKPIVFRTITSPMYSLFGEVMKLYRKDEELYASVMTAQGLLDGRVVGPVSLKRPCYIVEHLSVDGHMEHLVASDDFRDGELNFVNFGVPGVKHVRIDIYTGEHRIMNG
jgi:hypothetical protein